ncbi:MAG: cyclopropane-fatty-acyl-phospholipid synthase family protein [Planctomycetaceae bacterium]
MSQVLLESTLQGEQGLSLSQSGYARHQTLSDSQPLTWSQKSYRKLFLQILKHISCGQITLIEMGQVHHFGKTNTGLNASVTIHDAECYGRFLREGALGAAEAYLRGEWSTSDLTSLLRIFWQNQAALNQVDARRSWISRGLARLGHLLRDNNQAGSRKNIHEHYDLGNDFFELFLDETMMYSSAWFEEESSTLKEASLAKLDRICRKLQLSENDHVLEIGTGWGGFAHYAASRYGCRVTTTTISQEQYDYARNRIEQAGLSDKVELLLEDYRDLAGTYDKLVSIEMIEAVGDRHLDHYFEVCSDRLKPGGAMLIQAITIPDQRYASYLKSVDFIQKYIFPGGCLPSIGAINRSVARTDLRLIDLQDFASHYARTLRCWREEFFKHTGQLEKLGFDERFRRMWEYYFCYCEAGFEERATGVSHIVFAKPESRLEVKLV